MAEAAAPESFLLPALTGRQRNIARLMAKRKTREEIAAELGISLTTVKKAIVKAGGRECLLKTAGFTETDLPRVQAARERSIALGLLLFQDPRLSVPEAGKKLDMTEHASEDAVRRAGGKVALIAFVNSLNRSAETGRDIWKKKSKKESLPKIVPKEVDIATKSNVSGEREEIDPGKADIELVPKASTRAAEKTHQTMELLRKEGNAYLSNKKNLKHVRDLSSRILESFYANDPSLLPPYVQVISHGYRTPRYIDMPPDAINPSNMLDTVLITVKLPSEQDRFAALSKSLRRDSQIGLTAYLDRAVRGLKEGHSSIFRPLFKTGRIERIRIAFEQRVSTPRQFKYSLEYPEREPWSAVEAEKPEV